VSAAIAEGLQLECLSVELPEIEPEIAGLLPAKFCHKALGGAFEPKRATRFGCHG